jgi:hypothetical protein
MVNELVKAVLVLVVGFLLRLVLVAIGVEIDVATFDAIVAGIVVWVLTLLGMNTLRAVFPGAVRRGYLKEE